MVLVNRGFVKDAQAGASVKGMPGLRILGESVACESTVAADIEGGVDAAMPEIIAALTKPLTRSEKSPKQKVEKPPRIIFKGNNQEVNHFFYSKGWTDGMPIVPPTEKAVAEMMAGTDLPRRSGGGQDGTEVRQGHC